MGEIVDGGLDDAQSSIDEGDRQSSSQVEDFDLAVEDLDRKLRMKSCFMLTFKTLRQGGIDESKQMAQMAQVFMNAQGVTEEQAINQIIVARVMTCYMYIQPEEQHIIQSGEDLSQSRVKEIFDASRHRQVPQKPSQSSKRQWLLLDSVMKEDMTTVKDEQSAEASIMKEDTNTVKDEQSAEARAYRKMAELEKFLAASKQLQQELQFEKAKKDVSVGGEFDSESGNMDDNVSVGSGLNSEQAKMHDNVSVGGGYRWKRTVYVIGLLSAVFGPLVFILWRLLRRESVFANAKAKKGEKGKKTR